MERPTLSRRDALKLAAAGAAVAVLPVMSSVSASSVSRIANSKLPAPYSLPFQKPPVAQPVGRLNGRDAYVMTQRAFQAEILPGIKTTLWGYNGRSPGPTIRVQRGQPIMLRQINSLPVRHHVLGYEATTSTHLHGAPSLPQYDGYADDVSHRGQYKDYLYDNTEEARTIWYHDHAAHHTAPNIYMGLAAQYHVLDPAEDRLGLPRGPYDVPIIIGDALFAENGQLLFDDRSTSGLNGDVILVNGRPWPLMQVEPRKYRLRVLNASTARGYRLRLSSGGPMTVIATDGGLVRTPQSITELLLGSAERYDLVIDFAPYAGGRVELRNLGVEHTEDYDNTDKVMAFQVGRTVTGAGNNRVPDVLNPSPRNMDLTADQATKTRKLVFERSGGDWTINDMTWSDVQASGLRAAVGAPALGAVEIWELVNDSGGWFHPIHFHLFDFKILDRNGQPPRPQELGPKDVVYLAESQTVRIITRTGPHEGRYMIHCHNASHEDNDMMHQMVVGRDLPQFDPISAAPPQNGPPPPIPPL